MFVLVYVDDVFIRTVLLEQQGSKFKNNRGLASDVNETSYSQSKLCQQGISGACKEVIVMYILHVSASTMQNFD